MVAHDATSGGGGPRHSVAKKVFPAGVRRLGAHKALSTQRSCHHYGVSRQGLYQRRQRQAAAAQRAEQVLGHVRAVRTKLPRLGTRKLRHKIAPLLRAQGVACGRDALFTLLRQHGLLVPKKRSYTKTTDSRHRFDKHPNLVKDTPKLVAANQLWVSDITYLPTRQGTVYLSLVTDAFSRRIVGHHVHASLHTTGCLAALERAVRGAGRAATGTIHHSERGVPGKAASTPRMPTRRRFNQPNYAAR